MGMPTHIFDTGLFISHGAHLKTSGISVDERTYERFLVRLQGLKSAIVGAGHHFQPFHFHTDITIDVVTTLDAFRHRLEEEGKAPATFTSYDPNRIYDVMESGLFGNDGFTPSRAWGRLIYVADRPGRAADAMTLSGVNVVFPFENGSGLDHELYLGGDRNVQL